MLSEAVKAQDFAVRVLKGHLQKGRLAHTYLLTGEPGAGKEALALVFARALNCERGRFFEDCDCLSCRKTAASNHPDVVWLGRDPKVRSIKIEEVRAVMNTAALKPYEGKWKVFIFTDADRLTPDASNALLKTLEEPPAHTLFVLLVESKAHLLETIQSRSFEIRLRPDASAGDEEDTGAPGVSRRTWEDFFEEYQSTPRDEIQQMLDGLMGYFRAWIQNGSAQIPSETFVRAMDFVYETKEALDANANQKLALTRLAMQLRKILPPSKAFSR